MPTRTTRLTLVALAAAGSLAAAAPAMADSIVFIDGGNVWTARPDGTARVQLTDGGDWHSPTQSDDGTIAAVRGTSNLITLMARDGRPLRTIATQPARAGDGSTLAARPVMLSLSPDGSKLAYSYAAWSCPVASTCGDVQRATFYTYTAGTEASAQSLFGEQFSVSDPEWITNDRTIVFGGFGSSVSFDDLAGGGDSSFTRWIPRPVKDMGDGEVSRDGRRLAVVSDYGANTNIAFYAVQGNVATDNPPPMPLPACNTSRDAQMSDPSWSPDGSSVALHDTDGIDVIHFSELGDNHCVSTVSSFGAGSEPDWGPADPVASRFVASPIPTTAVLTPTSVPGGGASVTATPPVGIPAAGSPRHTTTGGGQVNSAGLSIVTSSLSLGKLRAGKATVKIAAPRAGRLSVRLRSGRTTIATATGAPAAAGVLTVRLSKPGRAALRAVAGRGSVLVTFTLGGKGQERLEGSGPLKLR